MAIQFSTMTQNVTISTI